MSTESTVGERVAKSLGDYVQVKDRIAKFYELFGGGRLVTDRVELWQDDGTPRIVVKALAYRTIDDPHPGVGWSWMELPGRTPYTKGSELENAETSAWGRAIGSLGILIDASIATQNEIDNKAEGEAPAKTEITTGETLRSLGVIERTGAVAKGAGRHSDLEWRQTPDGYHIGFLLEVGDGKAKPQVSIEGQLAVSLFLTMGREPMLGLRVTVKGELFEITAPQRRKFYRIVIKDPATDWVQTDDWRIPAKSAQPTDEQIGRAASGEQGAIEVARELAEAETRPLFEPSEEEQAAILEAERAEALA